jgi:hypothetical protein
MVGSRQTTLCVPLEVKPESCSRLSALIERLRIREDQGEFAFTENFARLTQDVPTLHFMSLSVFTSEDYDPIFILEANFDGTPGVFWGQLEAVLGPDLRDILRCCKRPRDNDGPLYDAVTEPESRVPVAPYFEARTQRPSVFHHGNRGMTRDRILNESALFLALRREIDDPAAASPNLRSMDPAQAHRHLRERMLAGHPWLDEPAPERFPKSERIKDFLRLLLFAVAVLFVLSLPGFLLKLAVSWTAYLWVLLIIAAPLFLAIFFMRKPLPGTAVPTKFNLLAFLLRHWILIAGYVIVATLLLIPITMLGSFVLALLGLSRALNFWDAFFLLVPAVFGGLLSLVATVPLIVFWLRYLERRDSSHDAPHVDERLLREMVRREDWIAQSHMGSIVLLKPGILRAVIVRAGHLGLGLLLRVTATDGYLGSMRTVHFAHWAFLNNGSRLLFFSNFDHSWDSYLDDFIEKAHAGLTLAWGGGVGFPPTNFLIYDGASHGRLFKNWALASRAVSRFWYSAYPTLTVDQIERNNRLANGLRQEHLTEKEALAWMEDL